MKLLIINGSYHKEGNTSSMIESTIEGFKSIDENAIIERIDLVDKNINFCTGCKSCGRNDLNEPLGRCAQDDDAREIFQKMLGCDRIILASPIYYGGVTAIMKRLIERSIAFSLYPEKSGPKLRNKINSNKKGYVILSSDCPFPLNKIMLYTIYPNKILKLLMNEAGIKYMGNIACSTYQKKWFLQKAYRMGKNLAK